jgi:hypothetical protein
LLKKSLSEEQGAEDKLRKIAANLLSGAPQKQRPKILYLSARKRRSLGAAFGFFHEIWNEGNPDAH